MNFGRNTSISATKTLVACLVLCIYAGWAGGQDSALGAIDFKSDILPIVETRCVSCHGPDQQKGEFRMDSKEAFEKGGAFGVNHIPGNPLESEIYKRILLPDDHDERMPAKGDPLSHAEIVLFRIWLAQGASFGEWTSGPSGITVETAVSEDALIVLSKALSPAPADALQRIEDFGAFSSPLYQDSTLVAVNFQLVGDTVTDNTLELLQPLAEQVVYLNLAETQVTDDGLAQISSLRNLRSLHLEKTQIGDNGLAHLAGLGDLEYLNLYKSEVGDAGLDHLASLTSLQKLYLWNSNVTVEGAAKLEAALPGISINMGPKQSLVSDSVDDSAELDAVEFTSLFDEGSCCASASAGGEECGHDCCVTARAAGAVCFDCNPGSAEGS